MAEVKGLLTEEALYGDWEILSGKIANAIKEVGELSTVAKEITFNIKGDENLLGFIKRFEEVEKVLGQVNSTTKVLNESITILNATSDQYGSTTAKALTNYADLKVQLTIVNDEIKKQNAELLKLKSTSGTAYDSIKSSLEPLIIKQRELQLQVTNSNAIINKTLDEAVAKREETSRKQIEAIKAQEIQEQISSIKLGNSLAKDAISMGRVQAEMVKLRLEGKELGAEYQNLSKYALQLRNIQNQVSNDTKQISSGSKSENSYHEQYQKVTTEDIQVTSRFTEEELKSIAAREAAEKAAFAEADAISKETSSVKQLSKAMDYATMSAEELKAVISFFRSGKITPEITKQIKEAEQALISLNPQFDTTNSTVEQLKIRLAELNVIWETGTETERSKVLPGIEELKIRLAELKIQYNSTGTEIEAFNSLSLQLEKAQSRLTVSTMDEAKALASLNVQMQKVNNSSKIEAQVNNAVAGSIEESILLVKKYELELKQLGGLRGQESIQNKQRAEELRILINEETEWRKSQSSSATQQALNIGNYKSANSALSQTRQEMAKLRLEGKDGSAEYAKLREEALRYHEALSKVNEETKKGVGITDRFVSIVERMGLRMIASLAIFQVITEAVTILWEQFTKLSSAEELAKSSLDDYINSTKSLSESIESMPFSEHAKQTQDLFKAESLIDYIKGVKDINLHLEGAFEAYKKIQSVAPGLLDDIEKKDFASLANSERMNSQLENARKYILLQDEINSKREIQDKAIEAKNKTSQQLQQNKDDFKLLKSPSPFTDAATNLYRKMQIDENRKDYEKLTENFKAYSKAIISQQVLLNKKESELLDMKANTKNAKNKSLPLSPLTQLGKGEKETIEEMARVRAAEIQGEIDKQKTITENVKISMDERLEANIKLQNAETDLEVNTYQKNKDLEDLAIRNSFQKSEDLERRRKEIKSGRGNQDHEYKKAELLNIKTELHNEVEIRKQSGAKIVASFLEEQNKFIAIRTKGAQENIKIIHSSNEEWIKSHEETFALQKNKEIQGYLIQENLLRANYDNKLIKKREYNKQLELLQKKELISSLDAEIEFDKSILRNKKLTTEEIIKWQEKQNNAEKALFNAQHGEKGKKKGDQSYLTDPIVDLLNKAGGSKLEEEDLLRAKKDFYDKTVELAQSAAQAIITIQNNQFQKEQQQLQIRQQQEQTRYQQQVASISATTNYQITKENQLSRLNAQHNAEEKNLQNEQNQLAIKKAKFDKQAAESGILLQTALGIAAVWGNPIYVANPILGGAITALISGIGAAQFAAAASTPIPQFWTGGITETPVFSAGERGVELITPPGKPSYFSTSTASIYHEPIGTKITNAQETTRMISYAVMNGVIQEKNKDNSGVIDYDKLARIIGEKFGEVGYDIIRTRPRQTKQESVRDVIREVNNSQAFRLNTRK